MLLRQQAAMPLLEEQAAVPCSYHVSSLADNASPVHHKAALEKGCHCKEWPSTLVCHMGVAACRVQLHVTLSEREQAHTWPRFISDRWPMNCMLTAATTS